MELVACVEITKRYYALTLLLLAPHAKYLVSYDRVNEAFADTAACLGITAYSALKKVDYLNANQTCLIVGAGGLVAV